MAVQVSCQGNRGYDLRTVLDIINHQAHKFNLNTHRQTTMILGGYDERRDYKFIYEYNPNEETWTKIGDMTMDRFNFAASVVPLSDFKDHFIFCLSN